MTENLLSSDDDLTSDTSDLLRTGFHARADAADDTVVIRLEGELDMATAPRLGHDLINALDARPPVLALDLSGLTFLDSTGIRVLITALRRAEAQGSRFILRTPLSSVLRALKLAGVAGLFVIQDEHT